MIENKGNTLSVMPPPNILGLGGGPPIYWVPQDQYWETQDQDPSLVRCNSLGQLRVPAVRLSLIHI